MRINRFFGIILGYFLMVTLVGTFAYGQTATHSTPGYVSPGTVTVSSQFARSVGTTNLELLCVVALPDGWLVDPESVSGDGAPVLDLDGVTILFTGSLKNNPLMFSYDLVVPPGQTGQKELVADFYYRLKGQSSLTSIRATPDPLVIDNLEKTIQVISPYGTATPAVGLYTNVVGTSLSPSVTQYSPYVGTTQYVCTGWTMTGNAPASGSANSFSMTVTDNAVLTWNWGVYNVMPTIAADLQKVGYRTATNVWDEALLLGQVSDPDAGDTKTLVSVDSHSVYGGAITRDSGKLIYTTPAHTDAVQDSFTYTVQDSKGAAVVGTVKVTVSYGATFIRVF